MKTSFGILVTAIVLFVFGFLYWAANPLPNQALNTVPDADAAASAVAEQFPETGMYSFMQSGIGATVIVNHGASEEVDLLVMVYGFIHYLLIAAVLAVVLRTGAPLSAHVRRAFILGLAAVVVVEGSDIIWWGYTWGWKLWSAAYLVLVFVIGALVLSKFLPRDPDIVA
ncbi:MAG: hypothetical protein OXP36_06505 [Gammaproteobacteria bacterium]|nr:hypothetical protein [Gammaproteobacteria bacterium]